MSVLFSLVLGACADDGSGVQPFGSGGMTGALSTGGTDQTPTPTASGGGAKGDPNAIFGRSASCPDKTEGICNTSAVCPELDCSDSQCELRQRYCDVVGDSWSEESPLCQGYPDACGAGEDPECLEANLDSGVFQVIPVPLSGDCGAFGEPIIDFGTPSMNLGDFACTHLRMPTLDQTCAASVALSCTGEPGTVTYDFAVNRDPNHAGIYAGTVDITVDETGVGLCSGTYEVWMATYD